jgi:TolA-binding protein
MSKHNNQNHEDGFEVLEESLTKSEQFIERNKKILSWAITAILGVALIYMAVKKYYVKPMEDEAQAQMFMAVRYFEKDSFKLALNGDGNYLGLNDIIDEYGWTKAGNLAKYYAGISHLKLGDYEDAIDLLEDFDSDDIMISAMALGAIGDAYAEMGKNEDAASYYEKAAAYKENEFTTPMFLFKAGLMNEVLNNNEKALELYEKIEKEYPRSTEARTIKKYIARVKVKLGKDKI